MATPSPSSASTQPRRSAMKNEDWNRTPPLVGTSKAVQIAEPDTRSTDDLTLKKQFSAGLAKRLSGRLPVTSSSSRGSVVSQSSMESPSVIPSPAIIGGEPVTEQGYHRHHVDHASKKLLAQVSDWLEHEKAKRLNRKSKTARHRRKLSPRVEQGNGSVAEPEPEPEPARLRAPSIDSDSSEVSFDRLQRIIEDSMAAMGFNSTPKFSPGTSPKLGRKHSRRSHRNLTLHKNASSDTEFFDGDVVVPACDVFLDNSKTLSQGYAKTPILGPTSTRKEEKEKQAWIAFKNEIIRLAHTLKLKGWRRVPLDSGETVTVERLSGALTNAVYMVSPPSDLIQSPTLGKRAPTKVLLRVYGPQVEHLIDRENELSVLRRLARKKIGPRLLGTFLNGRFEQFFNATTLTPAHIREPETSKQIAKRMRELHDGIDLLEEERDAGPAVWRNWDRWVDQAEKTITYLDRQVLAGQAGAPGYVCGAEWPLFKAMVEKYRKYLDEYYGSSKVIRGKLVFAHNDTQYGNILRIRPDDEKSPLLQPANEHKQLIVIDFEYAAANLPGLEFANHFSEWTYNYHDPVTPWRCDAARYPTQEQQRRFIKAYVNHRPQVPLYANHDPSSTPNLTPLDTPSLPCISSASSIHEFMLDARAPAGGWREEETRREEETEKRIADLMQETRLWRIANSAQWVAWGIIQAKIPGFVVDGAVNGEAMAKAEAEAEVKGENGVAAAAGPVVEEEEAAADDEFNYLAYAHERALFFWGDCLLLGLVKKEELPDCLRDAVKLVDR